MSDNFLRRRARQLGKPVADLKRAADQARHQVTEDAKVIRQNRSLIWGLLTGQMPPQPAHMRATHRAREIGGWLVIMVVIAVAGWWIACGSPIVAAWIAITIGLPAGLTIIASDRLAAACIREEVDHDD